MPSKTNMGRLVRTYQFLLRTQHFRPPILLIQTRRHVRRAMLRETAFHAVDGTSADFQTTVDRRRVETGFEEFLDLRLGLGGLFAGAGHG